MDTKKLRQKILDLAIRGKLVPQDPNDEPASVLLERIKAEKEQLIKEGKIKRTKKTTTSDKSHYENVPFEIPESWCWTTVSDISKSILYGVSESAKTQGNYKLLRITDIQNNQVEWESVPYTDFDTDKALSYLLKDNDILFARTGATVGKSYLVQGLKEDAIYASYLIRVQTFSEILPQYVKYYFESGYYWEQITQKSVGVGQPNVNGTVLGNLQIPIPPIQEQIRITTELTNRLNIFDILEQEKVELNTFISQTKSKIFDLAIQGKLVPQDLTDEPAIELLKRINPNFTPCDNSHYENVPDSWQEIAMGDICKLSDGEKINNKQMIYLDVKYLRGKTQGEIITNGKFINKGTTLILVDGENSGEIFITPIDGYQGSTFKILNISHELDKEYILLLIRKNQKMLRENKIGSAIPHLNKKIFKKLIIPIPPLNEQRRIVNAIETTFSHLDTITAEL